MNNNRSPWDIIGWGIIVVYLYRTLPLMIGLVIVFWLLGGFDWVPGFLVDVLRAIVMLASIGIITTVISSFSKRKKP